jgi:hypothetical protein
VTTTFSQAYKASVPAKFRRVSTRPGFLCGAGFCFLRQLFKKLSKTATMAILWKMERISLRT